MSHHLVAAENLSYVYPNGTRALIGISFKIHHGQSVGIIGPNGAGKSTLINHLNGCLLAAEGRVWIGDVVMEKGNRKENHTFKWRQPQPVQPHPKTEA